MADVIGRALVMVQPDMRSFRRDLLSGMGSAMKLGTGLIAAGAVGLFAGAVKEAATFEKSLSALKAVAEPTRAEFRLLSDDARKAGKETIYSANEAVQAQTELAKAGASTATILNGGLTAALNLATVGEVKLAKAAEYVAIGINTFGLRSSEGGRIADVFAAAAAKSAADVEGLGASLAQAGGVAHQFNIPVETVAGTLASFAQNGLKAGPAGVALKSMLLALTPQSKKAAGAMKEVNFSAYDAQGNFVGMAETARRLQFSLKDMNEEQRNAWMGTVFGNRSIKAIALLYKGGAEDIEKWTKAVSGSAEVVPEIDRSLKDLGGTAKFFGMSIRDTNATLGLFSKNGVAAADSGKLLKNFLQDVNNPSKEAAAALDKVGISARDSKGNFVGMADLADQFRNKLGGMTKAEREAWLQRNFGNDSMKAANILFEEGGSAVEEWGKKVGKGSAFIPEVAAALTKVKGAGEKFGVTMGEINATLGFFAEKGLKGVKSGEQLRGLIDQLTMPSKKAAGALEFLGIKTLDAEGKFIGLAETSKLLHLKMQDMTEDQRKQAMGQIFSNDTMGAANLLYDANGKAIDGWSKRLDAAGYAAEGQRTRIDNLSGDIAKLKGHWQDLMIGVGQGQMDGLRNVVQGLTKMLDTLGPALSNALAPIGKMIGDIAPMLEPFVRSFIPAMAAMVGLFEPIISTLATFGTSFMKGITPVLNALKPFGDAFANIAKIVSPLLEIIGELAGSLIKDLTPAIKPIIKFFKDAVDVIKPFIGSMQGPLKEAFGTIASAVGRVMPELSKVFQAIVRELTPVLENLIPVVAEIASALADTFVVALKAVIPLITILATVFSGVFEALNAWEGGVKAIGILLGIYLISQMKSVVRVYEEMVTGTFPRLNKLWAGSGDKVWTGMVTGAAMAVAGVSMYMAGMSDDVGQQLGSLAMTAVAAFTAFSRGDWISGGLTVAAGAIGYFFGRAKKEAKEAKADQDKYNDSVSALRGAFDTAGIDKYSAKQAIALGVAQDLNKTMEGTGESAKIARSAFSNLGADFGVVITAASNGRNGVASLNTEIERATKRKASIITKNELEGLQNFGRFTDLAKDSLGQLRDSMEAIGGKDNTWLYQKLGGDGQEGPKSLKEFIAIVEESGIKTEAAGVLVKRYKEIVAGEIGKSPVVEFLKTLAPKTQEAIQQQTDLARAQKLAADEQEKQRGSAERYSSAYDTVGGSLDKATTALKNWTLQQDDGKAAIADVKLSLLDYGKQLQELSNNPDMSHFEKEQKNISLVAAAQQSATDALGRYASESGGNFDMFKGKVTELSGELIGGLASSLHISKADAEAMVAQFLKMPTEAQFKVLADTTDAVTGLEDVQARITAYMNADPNNKIWMDAADAKGDAALINQLVDDYISKDPKVKAFLDDSDPKTKTAIINGLIDSIPRNVDIKVKMRAVELDVSGIPNMSITAAEHSPRPRALGGFITSPEVALIGEAGTELILPLTDPTRTQALLQQAGLAESVKLMDASIPTDTFSPAAGVAAGDTKPPDVGKDGFFANFTPQVIEALSDFGPQVWAAVQPTFNMLSTSVQGVFLALLGFLTAWPATVWGGMLPGLQLVQVNMFTLFTAMSAQITALLTALQAFMVVWPVSAWAGMAPGVNALADGTVGAFLSMSDTITSQFQAMLATLTADASSGGAGVVEALKTALNVGTSTVMTVVGTYAHALAQSLNPVLKAVGVKEIDVKSFAEGGINDPRIVGDGAYDVHVFGESGTHGEAYIPFNPSNRGRSRKIAEETVNRLGGQASWFAKGGVTGDVQGLNPEFMKRLQAWSAAVGQPYNVGSGYRSMAEQARLYARWLAHVPGQALAARPGASNHNFGLASDGSHWRDKNPGAFGLRFPMGFEPWHVEPIEAKAWRGLTPDSGWANVQPLAQPTKSTRTGLVAEKGNEMMQKVYDEALAWAGKQTGSMTGTGPMEYTAGGSAGEAAARGWIMQAIGLTGVPASWLGGLMTMARRESNFNPRAVNNWDSNAKKGTPSKGLLQTIDGTFRANMLPGHGDIFNPVDNASAAIRYILKRYGDISRVQQANSGASPKGYANGAIFDSETFGKMGEAGREVLIPLNRPTRALQLAVSSGLMNVLDQERGRTPTSAPVRTEDAGDFNGGILGGRPGNTYYINGISLDQVRAEIRARDESADMMMA